MRSNLHTRVGDRADAPGALTGVLSSACRGHSVAVQRSPINGWATVCCELAKDDPPHLVVAARAASDLGITVAYLIHDSASYGVVLAVGGEEVSRLGSAGDYDFFAPRGSERGALVLPTNWSDVSDRWLEVFGLPSTWGEAIDNLLIDMSRGGLGLLTWVLAAERVFGLHDHEMARSDFEVARPGVARVDSIWAVAQPDAEGGF